MKTKAGMALIVALVIGGWFAYGPVAAHAAKALNGRCGMHIGSLIRRGSGGSLYHFRIGPKYPGNTVKPGTCRGYVRVRISSPGHVGALAWQHYRMLHYKAKTALLITGAVGAVGGCTAAARYMVTGISILVDGATEGAAFPGVMLMAGTVGCGVGAHALYHWLTSGGPTTLKGVRMVK